MDPFTPPRRASSDPVYHSPHLHSLHSPFTTLRSSSPPPPHLSPSSHSSPSDSNATNTTTSTRSACFHHSSLQARTYLEPTVRPAPVESRIRSLQRQTAPSFEPLWEDAETFDEKTLEVCRRRSNRVNEIVGRLRRVLGAERIDGQGLRGKFQVSDSFHLVCGCRMVWAGLWLLSMRACLGSLFVLENSRCGRDVLTAWREVSLCSASQWRTMRLMLGSRQRLFLCGSLPLMATTMRPLRVRLANERLEEYIKCLRWQIS
jgi:hypothetical protein